MTATRPSDDAALWRTWRDAVKSDVIDTAIRELYDNLDRDIQAKGPTCWTSGKCCNFDAYGHRLYVTGVEVVWVLGKYEVQSSKCEVGEEKSTGQLNVPLPQLDVGVPETSHSELRTLNFALRTSSCFFQHNNLCTVHTTRPLGCRVFFCQEGTQDWQQEIYEKYLNELRRMHDEHDLPYRYMEWRQGLHDAAHYLLNSSV